MILDLATAKSVYLQDLQGIQDDTALTGYLTAIDRVIATHCGFGAFAGAAVPTVEGKSYTLYLSGVAERGNGGPWGGNLPLYDWSASGRAPLATAGSSRLLLPIWPVVGDITTIHEDENWAWGTDTLVADTDYTLFEDDWSVEKNPLKTGWSTARRALKIVLTAGYETIPTDMELAAGLQLQHLWNNRGLVGKTAQAIDGASAGVRAFTLLPSTRQLLAPFQLDRGQIG
jgi:hypothetical protein